MHRDITFPVGLPGFPGKLTFSFDQVAGAPLAYLVAKESTGPVFLVLTAPALYFPDLEPFDLEDQQAAVIEASERSELVSWLILAVRQETVTANLLGPLVVNLDNALAVQVVRQDLTLPVAAPLKLQEPTNA